MECNKFILLTIYTRKEENSQINNWTFVLRNWKNKAKLIPSEQKEINVRIMEIKEIENTKIKGKNQFNQMFSWENLYNWFKNLLDKPKKLKKKTKFLKPVMKERTLLSTLKKLRYLRKYYEQYYAIKLENLDEMEK